MVYCIVLVLILNTRVMNEIETIIEYINGTNQIHSEHQKVGTVYHGTQKTYFNNGNINCFYNMQNGSMHGIYQRWNDSREREQIDQNKDGREHGSKIIFRYME